MGEQPELQAPSHTSRRVKYTLNIAVAVCVAVAIAVLMNWIAYRQNARFDFTVTREYTLSPQTKTVLRQLEEKIEIATVFSADNAMLQRVEDLASEYGRGSNQVTVNTIDLASEPTAFYQRINDRFEATNTPFREAINQARDTLAEVQAKLKALGAKPFTAETAGPIGQQNSALQDQLLNVWSVLQQLDEQVSFNLEKVQQTLDGPLANFTAAKMVLETTMRDDLEAGLLAQIEVLFKQLVNQPATPNAIKDRLITFNEQIGPLRDTLRGAHEALSLVEGSEQYDQLRGILATTPCVVLFKGDAVAVIPVMEMFPDEAMLQQIDTDRDARFLGEERITGALVSLIRKPVLVVFVIDAKMPALGRRGQYNQVAKRMRSAGFDVREWNPQGGQMSQFGQPTPPSPPPQAAQGQKAVWIFLPVMPANPMNPMAGAGAGDMIASILQERLDAGDGVMVMLMADPGARFGAPNPIAQTLDSWGITAQLDRIVLDQVQLPDQRTQANGQIPVEQWPDDLPITQALEGMRGIFLQASPLVVGEVDGVTHTPIVQLRGKKLWAERDFAGLQSLSDADYDTAESADTFTVGVASQKENKRLVVIADPAWASDSITTYGQLGQGTADLAGAVFPANAELFVNSIYWLGELDELIAASPRSQDIRRIDAMDKATLIGYYWTLGAGMPAAVLLIGLTVWFMRRSA